MSGSGNEARHPIQVVARRVGLSPDVIRVWERRYAAVTPGRSATNRRLYSDEDLARLLLLRRATLGGRAIGNVAHLDSSDLASLVEADEAAAGTREAASPQGRLDACLDAVRSLDAARLRSTLQSAALESSTPGLLQRVLAPLMTRIGEDWRRGDLPVHQEHMATAAVRSLLELLRDSHSRSFGGDAIVVATPPGEPHELGALMAAVVAGGEGWQVTYLGPALPTAEIAAAARRARARAVALSVVLREAEPAWIDELARMRALLPPETAIVVGGRAAANHDDALRKIGARTVSDFREFREELGRLSGGPR